MSRYNTIVASMQQKQKIWSAVWYTFLRAPTTLIVRNGPIYQTALLQNIFIAENYYERRDTIEQLFYNKEQSFDVIIVFCLSLWYFDLFMVSLIWNEL